jgi:transcriptional regulator with XRE-family HTH domain
MHKHARALRRYMASELINQTELAERLKDDRSQVNRWLNGRMPKVSKLREISQKLGIPITELL